jgi:tetratricopeptide (TPR) repeat protein
MSAYGPFAAIFAALMIFGSGIAYLIMQQLPARDRLIAAAAPAPPVASSDSGGELPPDHPQTPAKEMLSKEIREFIAETESKARSHPRDLAAWNRLGDVTLRAAAFDRSYSTTATEAFSHVLKADPDNLDALRGIGNIDFDARRYDAAIAAYEHYLSEKPDDPDVRTDLGTMLLSSGAADQAIREYRQVLQYRPDFFEAEFNLGVAAAEIHRLVDARVAFNTALKIAPNEQARSRVNEMIASLGSNGASPVAGGAPPVGPASAGAAPDNFRDAIEKVVRNLPVAGDKVQDVRWDSQSKARVLMDNFPMDQMPPFAAAKFIADLKSGIDRAKGTYKVATPVQIDLCDAASGRVMRSVTE